MPTGTPPDNFNKRPATILVPTDEAWAAFLSPDASNEPKLPQLTPKQLDTMQLTFLTLLAYNAVPNITLTATNLIDGLSLPTVLDYQGNITVHVDPSTHNTTFLGFVNEPDTAANTTNRATVLFPDISRILLPILLVTKP
jgi:hypothetical protein